ncbi:hypothetical protein TWF730_010503 [Orbilia blumenaviensis]|uniref:Uncharacterized protein n=1 Tax=Orbilia blumenaviensis TaxID=1796055 RepID=A0AAV9USX8_9PEZI
MPIRQYQILLSLSALARLAHPYQIAFGGSDEITEILWENVPNEVDMTNPPCLSTGEEDVMDIWVRSTTSSHDRPVPPYIAIYAPSAKPSDQKCLDKNIIQVIAYYDEPGKMQSIITELPDYVGYWKEIYPDYMPDDGATQLIDGGGLEPGEVLDLDLETKVYTKRNYNVAVYDYDSVPKLESDGYGASESSEEDYWSAGGGDYGNGFDLLSRMSSP